jgi:hypothetical protein
MGVEFMDRIAILASGGLKATGAAVTFGEVERDSGGGWVKVAGAFKVLCCGGPLVLLAVEHPQQEFGVWQECVDL